MHSIEFPYKKQNLNLMPIIPIVLFGKGKNLATEAYVDSGALYSIFRIELVNLMGLDVTSGTKKMFVVGDGSFIPGYIFNIYVQIEDDKFLSEIAFSDKLNIGFNIIGRRGIFEHFDEIVFNEKQKRISLRYY